MAGRDRMRWGIGAAVAAALVVAVVLFAVFKPDPSSEDGAAGGPAAADFTVETVGGESFTLSEHRGEVVVVEFLAPGCPSCTVDVAALSKTAQQRPDVTLLLADVSGRGPEFVRDFYRGDLGASPELLLAPDAGFEVAKSYQATALGTTVVITPAGKISWKGTWGGDRDVLAAEIDKATAS
jgi:peroxiredoxin